jgi:hypothetical protein
MQAAGEQVYRSELDAWVKIYRQEGMRGYDEVKILLDQYVLPED